MVPLEALRRAYNVGTPEEALVRFVQEFKPSPVTVFRDFRQGLQDFLSGTLHVGGGVGGPPRAVEVSPDVFGNVDGMDTDDPLFAAQLDLQAGGNLPGAVLRTAPLVSSGFFPGKTYAGTI